MSYLHYPSDEDGGLVMLSKASKLNKLKLTKQNKTNTNALLALFYTYTLLSSRIKVNFTWILLDFHLFFPT